MDYYLRHHGDEEDSDYEEVEDSECEYYNLC